MREKYATKTPQKGAWIGSLTPKRKNIYRNISGIVNPTNKRFENRVQTMKSKGKGKGLDTCYSATYMSQTRDQQRFTISEVVADWHEPMVPQRIMWPSIARANEQLDPQLG